MTVWRSNELLMAKKSVFLVDCLVGWLVGI